MKINDILPEIVVADNFYSDPDAVRKIALETSYETSGYHKGQRSLEEFFYEGTQEKFEQLLGRKIKEFTMAGRFQFCTAEDPLVIHSDTQTHAAVVYLSPDAPPQTGTSFYRRAGTNIRRNPTTEEAASVGMAHDELIQLVYIDNYYDQTKWDLVDSVGNIYNRLVLWDAQLIHAASLYYGNKLQNCRVFQMFFFNAE